MNPDVTLPDVYRQWAAVPTDPFTVDPAEIAANREQWQDEWTSIVLR